MELQFCLLAGWYLSVSTVSKSILCVSFVICHCVCTIPNRTRSIKRIAWTVWIVAIRLRLNITIQTREKKQMAHSGITCREDETLYELMWNMFVCIQTCITYTHRLLLLLLLFVGATCEWFFDALWVRINIITDQCAHTLCCTMNYIHFPRIQSNVRIKLL